MIHPRTFGSLLLVLTMLGAACSSDNDGDSSSDDTDGTPDASRQVTGAVLYRERIAMPPGAVVTVRVLDVSLQDVAAVTVAEQVITEPGNVPVPFTIDVDPADIEETQTYAVEAIIADADGAELWRNDTHHPVLTQGATDDAGEIVVVAVR